MSEATNREVAVLNAALELPPAERAGYLDKSCADDAALRQQVEGLLRAHAASEGFLEAPPNGLADRKTILVTLPLAEEPGDKIGRYKLLQQIGEGGCGVVYMAEQEEPVRRRVALKVIKLGMDTKSVIARFEAERQALALMDHPNIAKVLDAGATETGRPYFVMELVRGTKITDYCDESHLSTRERLGLFVQICQAIQHAHQKGIIHRDIKPSNILITVNDGVPVPKVIDFGIAKATQGRLTDKTLFTAFEQFMGTPAYMSPEQAVMTSLDIDTRSDIYSLGVLLYELLTGKTPFDAKELFQAGLDEMRRTIREEEPQKPSTRLSTMQDAERTLTAKQRQTESPKLIHLVRGDLDWIVMKCLEKDRVRRFETANGLAADIQRHLDNEPVMARPAGRFYRFQKMARRNKLTFAAATAVVMALLLGFLLATWQAARASYAWRQAEAINRFLTEDFLFQATPEQNAREKKVTMEEVIETAARKLDTPEFAHQPELEATLRVALGRTYDKLGLVSEAESNLRRAVVLRRLTFGTQNRDTLAAQEELASLLGGNARKYEEAEALSRETWQGRSRLLGPENPDTVASLETYAQSLAEQKKVVEAERLARQSLLIRERIFGPNHESTINALGNLALVLATAGDYSGAEKYEREEVARFARIGAADTQGAVWGINNLAMYRFLQNDAEGAERLLVEVRPRATRIFGAEHPVTLHLQHVLARVLAELGRLDEAEALARETLAIRRRIMREHESTGRTMLVLGRVLFEKGQLDQAEPLLLEARALFREHYPQKPELAAQAANWLGAIQLARRAYPEAEVLLSAGTEQLFTSTAAMSPSEQRAAAAHLVQLCQALGKTEQALEWQRKVQELAKITPHAKAW